MTESGLGHLQPESGRHGLVEHRSRGAVLLAQVLAVAVVFALSGRAGLLLAAPPGYASALWAPAGFALAAVLLLGHRVLPGVLLGSFTVNCWLASEAIAAGETRLVAAAALIALGATAQAALTAWLLRRHGLFPARLQTGWEVSRFLTVAGPVGCTINAVIGPLALLGVGVLEPATLLFNVWNWWVGDTIGVVLVTPLVLAWVARPGTIWSERRGLITLPMLLAMTAVIAAFSVTRAGDQARIRAELGEQASDFAKSVGTSLQRTRDAVLSVRSFFRSSQFVSREEFRTFTDSLLAAHPEITALSWNAVVPHARRADYVTEARASGIADYRFVEREPDGSLVAAGERDSYVVVHYIEPLAGNRAALGFDVASDPTRMRAFEQARDTGEAVATARLWLVQAERDVAGILVVEPIYDGRAPTTVAERRQRLVGYVVGIVVVDRIVAAPFAELRKRGMRPSIHDVTDGLDQRLDSGGTLAGGAAAVDVSRFEFGGRQWELRIAGGTAFAARQRSPAAWFVLAGGLALTSILGGFLLLVGGHRHSDRLQAVRLRQAIERRRRFEADLHSEKERVVVTLQSIADGVISADADGRVTFINRVGEMLTGWENGTALGQPMSEVFRLRHPGGVSAADDETPLVGSGGEDVDDDIVLLGRDGREFGIRYNVSPLLDRAGDTVGTVTAFQDVTENRRMAREVAHRASHDALTGLVNRAEFERRLERALEHVQRDTDVHVVFFMDLDQFKIVNDTAGHAAGDQLLREVSELLRAEVRNRDTLARLGGDEFGMLFENCPLERGVAIARGCVAKLRDFRFAWRDDVFRIGVSIGVVLIDSATESFDSVMTRADAACYAAKDGGRNRVHVGGGKDSGSGRQELRQVAELRRVMDDESLLMLHAQPIVALGRDEPPRYELLLRYRAEDGATMPPTELIRTAERYGTMGDIDRWVTEEALSRYAGAFGAPTRIAINLSPGSFEREDLVAELVHRVQALSVEPAFVCFEIAESAVLRNLESATRVMRSLRERGFELAIDDFGSGVSSFECLRGLPVDYVKIDGRLVGGIAGDPLARGLVELVERTARLFGMRTIAEQVADEADLEVLAAIGIDYAQGFALGQPVALELYESGSARHPAGRLTRTA